MCIYIYIHVSTTGIIRQGQPSLIKDNHYDNNDNNDNSDIISMLYNPDINMTTINTNNKTGTYICIYIYIYTYRYVYVYIDIHV